MKGRSSGESGFRPLCLWLGSAWPSGLHCLSGVWSLALRRPRAGPRRGAPPSWVSMWLGLCCLSPSPLLCRVQTVPTLPCLWPVTLGTEVWGQAGGSQGQLSLSLLLRRALSTSPQGPSACKAVPLVPAAAEWRPLLGCGHPPRPLSSPLGAGRGVWSPRPPLCAIFPCCHCVLDPHDEPPVWNT